MEGNRRKFERTFHNLKVSLFRVNNLFPPVPAMLEALARPDFADSVVTSDCVQSLYSTEFRHGIPKLVSLALVKHLVHNVFDDSLEDYHHVLSYFPRNDFIYYFYNVVDNKWLKKLVGITLSYVPTNCKIRVPFSFCEEHMRPNELYPGLSWRMLDQSFHDRRFEPSEVMPSHALDGELGTSHFQVRFLSKLAMDLHALAAGKQQMSREVREEFRKVILHIHGGGFISMSSSSHQSYLRKFVRQNDAVLFSIDYPLSPMKKYPDILDSVLKGYLFVLVLVSRVLGVGEFEFVLVGDSAGGNLACALTNWLILNGLKRPRFMLLDYPGGLTSAVPRRAALHALLPARLRRRPTLLQHPQAVRAVLPRRRQDGRGGLHGLHPPHARRRSGPLPRPDHLHVRAGPAARRQPPVRQPTLVRSAANSTSSSRCSSS